MTITHLFNFDKTFHTSFCFFRTSKLVAVSFYCLLCERFEPRSHFISRFSVIVRVNVVLKSTIVVDSDWHFDNLCGSHLQSQSELYHISWCYYTLVIDPIGQFSCDVIGRLSVNWLWRFVMSLVHFNPSIVTVKQSFIVSQIVSCPVVLS